MKEEIIQFSELPYYLTVKKIINDDSVKVVIESKIHVNRLVEMPTSFSIGFVQERPKTFRNDVLNFVVRRFDIAPNSILVTSLYPIGCFGNTNHTRNRQWLMERNPQLHNQLIRHGLPQSFAGMTMTASTKRTNWTSRIGF